MALIWVGSIKGTGRIKTVLNCYDQKSKIAAILKIYFPFLLLNRKANCIAITSLVEERANLSALPYVCSIFAGLDLSVSSSSWCYGRAAVCDCGTPWTFLLPFFGKSHRGDL